MSRLPLTVDANGQPDMDLAADLALPLLLAQLAADDARRPSLKIVTANRDHDDTRTMAEKELDRI